MVTNSKKRNKTRSLCRCWAAVTLLVLAGFVADIFVGVPSSEGQKQQEQEEKEEVASASRHQRPAGEAGAAAAPAVTNRSTCIELNAWLPRRTEPAVVLQLVSAHYVDLERNFVRLMERNSGFTRENLYLMCLDREAFEALRGFGIRCVPVNDMRDYALHDLWRLRLRVLRCLLAKGHDVIMSDSDALWLHDPVRAMQDIEGVNSSSIVASKGGYPFALAEAWGSTICMGFVLFRAAPDEGMRVFQREVELVVSESGDDQVREDSPNRMCGRVLTSIQICWIRDLSPPF